MKIWLALFLSFSMLFPLEAGKEILEKPTGTVVYQGSASLPSSDIPLGEAAAAVQIEGEVWPLDPYGRVLSQEELRDGLPQLFGLTFSSPVLGEEPDVLPEQQALFHQVVRLLVSLSQRDMLAGATGFIWVGSNTIRFGYGEELTVVVSATDLDPDIEAVKLQGVLNACQERGDPLTGTLELNYGKQEARLLVERWLPEGQAGEDGRT